MKRSILATFVLAIAGCGGAGSPEGADKVETVRSITQNLKKAEAGNIIRGSNELGARLLRALAQDSPGENLLLSPSGVSMALTLAYNGANGTTRLQMAQALGIGKLDLDTVNQAQKQLRELMQSVDPMVETSVFNSVWLRAGQDFRGDFLQRNRDFFEARASVLDFSSPAAAEDINSWAASATRGRIDKLVDSLDPQTVMLLINAIYFKGAWKAPFDADKTQRAPFYISNAETTESSMMSQDGKFDYYEDKELRAVSLPYGSGRLAMLVVLPAEGRQLSKLLQDKQPGFWQKLAESMQARQGSIVLPRFRLRAKTDLTPALQGLGMQDAFTPERADFSGMRQGRDLFLQKVQQSVFIQVDEQGTEAAAVTDVTVGVTSYVEPFKFRADRPFLYAIRDGETGAILFLGIVAKPQE